MTDTSVQSVNTDTELNVSVESFEDTQQDEQSLASRKAAEMGESRKMFAELALEAAESNPLLKDRLASLNQSEKNYLEKKFGDRYKNLFQPKVEISALEKTVESLAKDRDMQRVQKLSDVKEKLGLTLDQAGEFDELVGALEGRTVAGKLVTLDRAVEMVSKQMKPELSSSFSNRGDVTVRPEDKQSTVKIPLSEERVTKNSWYTGAKSVKDFEGIAQQIAEKGSYTISIGKK